jgi:integrase
MKRVLTDTFIKSLKPAADGKAYKKGDGGGLFLLVKPNGVKLWRYKYRLQEREQLFSLGQYPEISLAAARKEHDKARELIAKGEHPKAERDLTRLQKQLEGADSFKGVANEWIEGKKSGWSPYYKAQIERAMKSDVFPAIGLLPIRQVTPLHLRAVVKKVEGRGAEIVAENIRQWCSQVFRFAIVNGRAEVDPAAALKGIVERPKIKNNVALTPDQIAELLTKLDQAGGNRSTRIAIELLLLTFVRTQELRMATWMEFLENEPTMWRVPAGRMKMGVEHLVPLSKQATALIAELRKITGAGKWLFPNFRDPGKCMSATTINRALERMGLCGAGTIGFSAHGFRGTASTLLNEWGFQSEAIERQLAHSERDKVKASYNKAQHLEARVQMMQAWADKIDVIRQKTVD